MTTHRCCDNQKWVAVADLGHAGRVDFDLGQCENCGKYLMATWYVGPESTCILLSKRKAERFLRIQGAEQLRRELKRWLESG
jgi:hypothetical protein